MFGKHPSLFTLNNTHCCSCCRTTLFSESIQISGGSGDLQAPDESLAFLHPAGRGYFKILMTPPRTAIHSSWLVAAQTGAAQA